MSRHVDDSRLIELVLDNLPRIQQVRPTRLPAGLTEAELLFGYGGQGEVPTIDGIAPVPQEKSA